MRSILVIAALGAAAALTAQTPTPGYLDPSQLPDSARFIAPPPAPGTPAFAADRAAYDATGLAKGGPAWNRAIEELDPKSATLRAHVSCAIGAALDPATTPVTLRLLQRTLIDGDRATQRAKLLYKRPRPYATEPGSVACDPSSKGSGGSPSYPSGYASAGWLWGLLLARIVPDRAGEILAFGASVGDNRVACRVHYPSDIMAGRMVGSAVFEAEMRNEGFLSDLAKARGEITKASLAGPPKSCG